MTIRKLRNIKSTTPMRRDLSVLEKLIRLEMDESFWGKMEAVQQKEHGKRITMERFAPILQMYGITVTSERLVEYVNARFDVPKEEGQYLHYSRDYRKGVLSGLLLEKMGRAHPDESIIIDGKGRTFNYLFFSARYSGNLTIQNIQGTGILSDAGKEGQLTIAANKITGEFNFSNISHGGELFYLGESLSSINFYPKKCIVVIRNETQVSISIRHNVNQIHSYAGDIDKLTRDEPYDHKGNKKLCLDLLRIPVARWNDIFESYLGGQYDAS